jgi:hypothetical protein
MSQDKPVRPVVKVELKGVKLMGIEEGRGVNGEESDRK